ncbi:A/G-specific adenine glycosylase [Cypionkella sp.]|uniref:A/G-specific adenine glycosylase n=1 Tax=Cypionkella sp. TaxID=2811411 RepID=UPI0026333418|nr:A/G-specific adenine glycosylase [Cypionkella sp.]MDB5664477.1 A/G-specific adenine glycosylase [Cypionkella sp.]
MPWRVPPAARAAGVRADPYRVWMSEVMLQQTTVAAVTAYFQRFVTRWPTVADLAAAADGDVMAEWAGLGYYARARNLLACARAVVCTHGGVFPDSAAAMRALPGVGPYTAAAVAAICYDEPAVVVDGNVERVMARLFAVLGALPGAKPELVRLAGLVTPALRPGDYAQAVMDLGATVCTPRNPACVICPLLGLCEAQRLGIAGELPRKTAKAEKPTRAGVAWVASRGEDILVERRAERGLLGGMLGFPSDGWDGTTLGAPFEADWRSIGAVKHTFTHFHLVLQVMVADSVANPQRGEFVQLKPDDLPTLMRKAYDLAFNAKTPR